MPQPDSRIAIIGGGALGQQMAQHLRQQGRRVAGFFDDTLPRGATAAGAVLGPIAAAPDLHAAGAFDELLLGVGYQHLEQRQQLFEQLAAAGVPFGQFVHPSAYIDASVQLGPGTFISPGCVLDLNVQLAANVLLYTGCVVAHDTHIGAHTLLGPGVRLAGRVQVGSRCFLGIGTTVIDSLELGADVRTGGGTVVIQDLPEPGTYVGVPARRLR
ncbi:NeuD/PglB/VioB family sugar acetyltransferase [Hymenobacter psychrotolerans]|uniref:Sugar O-acyltransferase, sialic acid O-acetyltransferase NeuD family n=1 Tax=Hymenobacter psychrotolerans DSM 18569 TaxID=1121959 RepID=A0A1M7BHC6_9BACT|nr:NeuD/PglB/VioB family sugar acetyltransferase [Hymenobacter psychrotolerans]SHL54354.1 sugar O-acyltransferase, sialic acid O-acetyltransferase NeuD family [Hymenobacter psychrotolerans DSM 18569]